MTCTDHLLIKSNLSSLPRSREISDHFTPNWMRETRPEIYLGSAMAQTRTAPQHERLAAPSCAQRIRGRFRGPLFLTLDAYELNF